jgi:homogentisate 1,2-dioxygenase
MPAPLSDPTEYQKIFHWAETQKDGTIPSFAVRKNDPYEVRSHGYPSAYDKLAEHV